MTITMDAAGRVVLPKAIRDGAGLIPGSPLHVTLRDGHVEIEPAPREIRIVDRDGFRVAEPVEAGDRLTGEAVRRVRSGLRERKGR